MKSEVPHLLSAHKLTMIVQWGSEPNRDISAYQGREVPLIMEFATSELDRTGKAEPCGSQHDRRWRHTQRREREHDEMRKRPEDDLAHRLLPQPRLPRAS